MDTVITTADQAKTLVETRRNDVVRGVIPAKLTFPGGDVQSWIVITESSFPNLRYVDIVLENGKVMPFDSDELAHYLRQSFPQVLDGLR